MPQLDNSSELKSNDMKEELFCFLFTVEALINNHRDAQSSLSQEEHSNIFIIRVFNSFNSSLKTKLFAVGVPSF